MNIDICCNPNQSQIKLADDSWENYIAIWSLGLPLSFDFNVSFILLGLRSSVNLEDGLNFESWVCDHSWKIFSFHKKLKAF